MFNRNYSKHCTLLGRIRANTFQYVLQSCAHNSAQRQRLTSVVAQPIGIYYIVVGNMHSELIRNASNIVCHGTVAMAPLCYHSTNIVSCPLDWMNAMNERKHSKLTSVHDEQRNLQHNQIRVDATASAELAESRLLRLVVALVGARWHRGGRDFIAAAAAVRFAHADGVVGLRVLFVRHSG